MLEVVKLDEMIETEDNPYEFRQRREDKDRIARGYVVLEAIDPTITRHDINVFSIGGYVVKDDDTEMQFDWDDSETSVVDGNIEHNLRFESTLRNYNTDCYPGYKLSEIMGSTEITEIYYEAFFYDKATNTEGENIKLKLVDFVFENRIGDEFSLGDELIEKFNKSQE